VLETSAVPEEENGDEEPNAGPLTIAMDIHDADTDPGLPTAAD